MSESILDGWYPKWSFIPFLQQVEPKAKGELRYNGRWQDGTPLFYELILRGMNGSLPISVERTKFTVIPIWTELC